MPLEKVKIEESEDSYKFCYKIKFPDKDKGGHIPIFGESEIDYSAYNNFNWNRWCFWYGKDCECPHIYCSVVRSIVEEKGIEEIIKQNMETTSKKRKTCEVQLLETHNYYAKAFKNLAYIEFNAQDKMAIMYSGIIKKGYNYIDCLFNTELIGKYIITGLIVPSIDVLALTVHKNQLVINSPEIMYIDQNSSLMEFKTNCATISIPPEDDNVYKVDITIKSYKNMYFGLRDSTEKTIKAIMKLLKFSKIEDHNIKNLEKYDKVFSFIILKKEWIHGDINQLVNLIEKWNTSSVHATVQVEISSISLQYLNYTLKSQILFPHKDLGKEDLGLTFILIKPSGMFGQELYNIANTLTQDLNFNIINFKKISLISDDEFNKLYPTALSKIFGCNWYNYLKSGPLFCMKCHTSDINVTRELIFNIRRMSKNEYPENPIHCSDSIQEAEKNLNDFFSILDA